MVQKSISQAVKENRLDLTEWAENMLQRIRFNFIKQYVWPYGEPGPYVGYKNKPKSKKSTGAGLKSLYAAVYAGANGDTEKISFFFNYYLYFVDMGVGAGQTIHEVDRSANARYNRRYKKWKGEGDRQSRPIISMELRHQIRRLDTLISAYYGDAIVNGIIASLTDEEPDLNNASNVIYAKNNIPV